MDGAVFASFQVLCHPALERDRESVQNKVGYSKDEPSSAHGGSNCPGAAV